MGISSSIIELDATGCVSIVVLFHILSFGTVPVLENAGLHNR
jgi:hypothetical protein